MRIALSELVIFLFAGAEVPRLEEPLSSRSGGCIGRELDAETNDLTGAR
jgi:hypothetical protein